MKTVKIEIVKDSVLIKCPYCDNWEEMNVDESRKHFGNFDLLNWFPGKEDEDEVSHMICLGCRSHLMLEWDYTNTEKSESEKANSEIGVAKDILSKYGYYTASLYSEYDVQSRFICDREQAMKTLDGVFGNNDYISSEIHEAVSYAAEVLKLEERKHYVALIRFKGKQEIEEYRVTTQTSDLVYDDSRYFYYFENEAEIKSAMSENWGGDFVVLEYKEEE